MVTALAASNVGDEIWVARGEYFLGANRTDSFVLKQDVEVYGGFVGTETLRDQRNFVINTTILSGDIGVIGDSSDNSYHVVHGGTADQLTILDGFSITSGNADGTGTDRQGGGIFVPSNRAPVIQNCEIIFNSADPGSGSGGGIYAGTSAAPTIRNCTLPSTPRVSAGLSPCGIRPSPSRLRSLSKTA